MSQRGSWIRNVCVAAIASSTIAPSTIASRQEQQPFRAATQTVAVYTTVTDDTGRLVPDLTRDDFEVYDNGERQPLAVFESAVQPISVVMLLDRSASMLANFRLVEVAAGEFIKTLLPSDRARIGSFAGRIQLDPREFTSDRGELLTILRTELQPAGPTPLWNAVSVGVTALRREERRRVILVFTDGFDSPTGRSVGYVDAMRAAQADNVMVYAIGLSRERMGRGRRGGSSGTATLGGFGQNPSPIERPDPGLARIAAETGGGYFELTRVADLPATFARVGAELHRQYLLGFSPPKLDGKTHRIEVRVKRSGVVARARRNYMAARP